MTAPAMFEPLLLLEKCIGNPILILMRDEREVTGTLSCFDPELNVVLTNATSYESNGEMTQGLREIVLNGHHVAVFVPGGTRT